MKLWSLLPVRAQQFIAVKVNHYGYRHNKENLVIWGITHFPITIEEDE